MNKRQKAARATDTDKGCMNGYWVIITYAGEDARRFRSAFEAGAYANRVYGLGNWTFQWRANRSI